MVAYAFPTLTECHYRAALSSEFESVLTWALMWDLEGYCLSAYIVSCKCEGGLGDEARWEAGRE